MLFPMVPTKFLKKIFNYKKMRFKKKTWFFHTFFFLKLSFQGFPGLGWTWNCTNRWHKCLNFNNPWSKIFFFTLVYSKWRLKWKIFVKKVMIFFFSNDALLEKVVKNKKFLKSLEKCTRIFCKMFWAIFWFCR